MGIMNGCLEEVAPYAAMLTLECLIVGLNTLSKAAMSKGMSHFVFAFYANALAFLIIFPVCLILDRRKRAPLNLSIICKFFFISLLGSTINPNCTYAGIDYSSPTLGSSMRNLIPAFTFLLAVIFRMEKLNLRRCTSQVKIMATLLSVGGAFVLTFYEGPPLLGSSAKEEYFVSTIQIQAYHQETNIFPSLTLVVSKEESHWLLGGFLLAIASLCISIWVTAQGPIVKEYPSELTTVTFYFLFGSIQCAIVALFAERNNPNAWILRPHVELLPVAYSAVFTSLGVFFVEIWCVKKKGPLFVALFKPPGVAIAAALNFILLHERLHTGTVVGSVIVITGFYGVIWAKSKENEEIDDEVHSQERTPLLETGFPPVRRGEGIGPLP